MSGDRSIIRIDMGAGGWTAVPRAIFSNESGLSLAARGLLGWFLTRPEGWEVRIAWCMTHHGIGEKGWSTLAAELAAAGFYHRTMTRDARGHIRTAVSITPTPSPSSSGVGSTDPAFTGGRCDRDPVSPGLGGGGVLSETVKELKKQQQPDVVFSDDLFERNLLSEEEHQQLIDALAGEDRSRAQALADEVAGALRARGRVGPTGIRNAVRFMNAISDAPAAGLTYSGHERALREARAGARKTEEQSADRVPVPPPAETRALMERLRKEMRGVSK